MIFDATSVLNATIALINKYLPFKSDEKILRQNQRIKFISGAYIWLNDKEIPCTGPVHFINKKVSSVKFNEIAWILTYCARSQNAVLGY